MRTKKEILNYVAGLFDHRHHDKDITLEELDKWLGDDKQGGIMMQELKEKRDFYAKLSVSWHQKAESTRSTSALYKEGLYLGKFEVYNEMISKMEE